MKTYIFNTLKLNKMNQKRKEEKKLNSNLNLKSKKDNNEFTSSSLNNTLSPKSPLSPRSRKSPRSPGNNLSYTKSRESISSLKKAKIRKMEEEKRDLEKKKKEFLNFIEDAHRKEKRPGDNENGAPAADVPAQTSSSGSGRLPPQVLSADTLPYGCVLCHPLL